MLDLDATDDPLHGHQEGRFFHGYYDAWCYLPLYIFCGRHLLAAKLRRANIDASAGAVEEVARIVRQLRRHWPHVRILLRADSGFAREALMAWCEANGVDYLFGLARNPRLVAVLEAAQAAAQAEAEAKGRPARRYKDLLDIFSRYVVGWMVADRENAALAATLIEETCLKQDIEPQLLTLHSDRGAPMTSKCTAQLLADLGVTRSLGRPQVSDDNPFSEAQFKTLKYHPSFPGRFDDISAAIAFCRSFFEVAPENRTGV